MDELQAKTDAAVYRECDLPYLTNDLPGVGGVIKKHPADFVVSEIPLYPPSGEGTHVYVRIEKQGITTDQAVHRLARALGRQRRDVGYAGLKDAHAITRQTLSIEHVDPNAVAELSIDGMRVLAVSRHTNKLRLGHLAANYFAIRIRDVNIDDVSVERAQAVLAVLKRRGVPNYFGPQRFGNRGTNAAVGLAVIRGDFVAAVKLILDEPDSNEDVAIAEAKALATQGEFAESNRRWPHWCKTQQRICHSLARGGDAKRAWMTVDHAMRRLYISAAQSFIFNRVLAKRIASVDQVMTGDVAMLHRNGACFSIEDAAAEQPRADQFEISPTGPIIGRRMTQPTGQPAQIERDAITTLGLTEAINATGEINYRDKFPIDGSRRPLRVPPTNAQYKTGKDETGTFLELKFTLPPGSYATVVAREVCKT